MTDSNDEIAKELSQFLPANTPAGTTPEESFTYEITVGPGGVDPTQAQLQATAQALTDADIQQVALDDQGIDLAREAAKPKWYESGWMGILMLGAPALAIMTGAFGGFDALINFGVLAYLFACFPSCLGLLLFVGWVGYFSFHRANVRPIRQAIKSRTAMSVAGPIQSVSDGLISAGGILLYTKRPVTIADSLAALNCSTLYAPADDPTKGALLAIKGADGRIIYPPTGTVPTLLKWWAVVASVLVSFALTQGFSAQSQIYSDAATHLSEINAAVQCTKANGPGDACWRWTDGTVLFDQSSSSSDFSFFSYEVSVCHVTLRWAGSSQQGDIRANGTDCSINLQRGVVTPARVKLVRNYAIEADIAGTAYRTDRWPPFGNGAYTLAAIFRVVSILWLVWPIVHVGAAVLYRFRRRPVTASTKMAKAMR